MEREPQLGEKELRFRASADPYAPEPAFSPLKDMMILCGLNAGEVERVLEDALEKLKSANMGALLDSFDDKTVRASADEPRPRQEERAIRFIYEKIYDSVVALQVPREDGDAERLNSLFVSTNRPSGPGFLVSGVPTISRTTSAKLGMPKGPDRSDLPIQRKKSTDLSGTLDLVDSMPIFQSALSQAAFIQFYEDKRKSVIQKSANLSPQDDSARLPLASTRRAQVLFNQLAAEIVGRVVEGKAGLDDQPSGRDISPWESPERVTKTSVIVSNHKNTLDVKRQSEFQMEQDFDKYLNLQSKNIQELHLSEINHRLLGRDSLREPKASRGRSPVKPKESQASRLDAILETQAKQEGSGIQLGSSFRDANEFTYQELQSLSCLLFERLLSHSSEAEFCQSLADRPKMANLLRGDQG